MIFFDHKTMAWRSETWRIICRVMLHGFGVVGGGVVDGGVVDGGAVDGVFSGFVVVMLMVLLVVV